MSKARSIRHGHERGFLWRRTGTHAGTAKQGGGKNQHPGSMQQGRGGERGMANGDKNAAGWKNRGM